MREDWILDVLADLRNFAGKNGLGASERQLDKVMITVAGELASMQGIAQGTARSIAYAGEFSRPIAESQNTR